MMVTRSAPVCGLTNPSGRAVSIRNTSRRLCTEHAAISSRAPPRRRLRPGGLGASRRRSDR